MAPVVGVAHLSPAIVAQRCVGRDQGSGAFALGGFPHLENGGVLDWYLLHDHSVESCQRWQAIGQSVGEGANGDFVTFDLGGGALRIVDDPSDKSHACGDSMHGGPKADALYRASPTDSKPDSFPGHSK